MMTNDEITRELMGTRDKIKEKIKDSRKQIVERFISSKGIVIALMLSVGIVAITAIGMTFIFFYGLPSVLMWLLLLILLLLFGRIVRRYIKSPTTL
jgi:hypothetical protein